MKKPTIWCNDFITPNYEFEEGETIEEKVRRVVETKEPIEDGAPLIYTPKENGVVAAYNIRTDRWEIAQDAMSIKYKAEIAKTKENADEKLKKVEETKTEPKVEPTQTQESA